MSQLGTSGGGVSSDDLANALRGLARALEAAPESIGAKEKSNSGATSPEEAKSKGSGDHECTCGRRFESAQALAGHIGGSKGRHVVAGSEPKSESEPSRESPSEIARMARSLHPDEEAAKKLLREAKSGKKDWVGTFGECAHPDCSFGANGFDTDYCSGHGPKDDAAEEGPESYDSAADYMDHLIEDEGVDVVEAATEVGQLVNDGVWA